MLAVEQVHANDDAVKHRYNRHIDQLALYKNSDEAKNSISPRQLPRNRTTEAGLSYGEARPSS